MSRRWITMPMGKRENFGEGLPYEIAQVSVKFQVV